MIDLNSDCVGLTQRVLDALDMGAMPIYITDCPRDSEVVVKQVPKEFSENLVPGKYPIVCVDIIGCTWMEIIDERKDTYIIPTEYLRPPGVSRWFYAFLGLLL